MRVGVAARTWKWVWPGLILSASILSAQESFDICSEPHFISFEIGSYVAQAGHKLSLQLRMINCASSSLYPLGPGIMGMHHIFMGCQESSLGHAR